MGTRFAQIVNGLVVATTDRRPEELPDGRTCVDITNNPEVHGGERYDEKRGVFTPAPSVPSMTVADLVADVKAIKAKVGA